MRIPKAPRHGEMHSKRSSKVLLVNSNNNEMQAGIPLGLLAVAAVLERDCQIASVVVDLPFEAGGDGGISRWISEHARFPYLFVGMSTVCNTLPRTLSVARAIRTLSPSVPIVLGGPQATVSSQIILARYDFVDCVVCGEAEHVIAHLCECILSDCWIDIDGVAFRRRTPNGHRVGQNTQAMAPAVDVETLPVYNYDLYGGWKGDRSLSIEVGRGCPYSCTFCSTKGFFKRQFRMKSPLHLVRELVFLRERYSATHFQFIHDMFTADRRLVIEVCNRLVRLGPDLTWSCSARTDCVDAYLLQLMYKAGCRSIYFGLETGSQYLQEAIRKGLNVADAKLKIQTACEYGFSVVVSLILGFPGESPEDIACTLNVAAALLAFRPKVGAVQIHLLSPVSGTEMTTEHWEELARDGHLTDFAAVRHMTAWENQEVIKCKSLFSSFYFIPNDRYPRDSYRLLCWIMMYAGKYDGFYRSAYAMLGESFGAHLVAFATTESAEVMRGINQRSSFQSIPVLTQVLERFVARLPLGQSQQVRLHDSIRA